MDKKNFAIEAGDILIVQGKSIMSKILVAAQKPFYFKNNASHILITIADGFFIHSTGDKGVHVINFQELLPQIEDNWRAIRIKDLSDIQKEELSKVINHYRGQSYNKKFFCAVEDASFCSELAAKIYKQAEISILDNLEPQYVKPSNFVKEADKGDSWLDITQNTKDYFDELRSSLIDYKLIDVIYKRTIAMVDMRRNMDKFLEDLIFNDKHDIFTDGFKETLKEIKQDVANKVQAPYWDDTFKKEK